MEGNIYTDTVKNYLEQRGLPELVPILERQTAKGLKKYGTLVNPDDYTFKEWENHMLEELVDMMVYLVMMGVKVEDIRKLQVIEMTVLNVLSEIRYLLRRLEE